MPRRNRPKGARRGDDDDERPLSPSLPLPAPQGWTAWNQQSAPKRYVCKYCGGGIEVGEANVVAWPRDREDERRHWHRGCWHSGSKSLR